MMQVLKFFPVLLLSLTSWEKMVSGHRGGGSKTKELFIGKQEVVVYAHKTEPLPFTR